MKVAVAGGTGNVGSRVVELLKARGDEVVVLSRSTSGWRLSGRRDPADGERRCCRWLGDPKSPGRRSQRVGFVTISADRRRSYAAGMPRTAAAAALAVTLLLSGCGASTAHQQAPIGPAAYTFTCCTAHDVEHVYHPGDVVTVHWIRRADPTTRGPGPSATLDAELGGAFDRVSDAKSGRPDAIVLRAAPLHIDDPAHARPTSRIRIPRTAPPGLYNLTFTIDSTGGRITGTSLITVQPR